MSVLSAAQQAACSANFQVPQGNVKTAARIATIGSQQLQARMVTSYYGLSMDYIKSNTVLLGTA